jgi:Leucine-rich repeat (LRR) protein
MPENFGNLNELQILLLDENRLTEFPNDKIDVMGSLQMLNLNMNYIEVFPSDLPYLYRMEKLSASHNNLIELPNDLWKMKNLQNLEY